MMFCRNCGAKVEPDGKFCMQCGTPLTQTGSVAEPQPPPPTTPSDAAYSSEAVPPLTPPPPKKKLHWIWKDRIARVVATVLVMGVLIPMINQCKAGDPIENPAAQKILTAVYPYTNTTYQEGLNESFQKPKWEFIGPNPNGDICVEFTGKNDKDENVMIQLSWRKEDGGVYCNWIELEGKELSISLDEMEGTPEEKQIFSALEPKQMQTFLYREMLFEMFEPYFLPEQKEQAYAEQEALLMEVGFAALPGLFDSDAFNEIWQQEADAALAELSSATDAAQEEYAQSVRDREASAASEPPPPQQSESLPPEQESDHTYDDYTGPYVHNILGRNLGELIGTYGELFTLAPVESEYTSGLWELVFLEMDTFHLYFWPQHDTPSDEDLVVEVKADMIVLDGLPANRTLAELEAEYGDLLETSYNYRRPYTFVALIPFYDYDIYFQWSEGQEQAVGPATAAYAVLKQ